jgi:hypothetical protein
MPALPTGNIYLLRANAKESRASVLECSLPVWKDLCRFVFGHAGLVPSDSIVKEPARVAMQTAHPFLSNFEFYTLHFALCSILLPTSPTPESSS